MMEHRMKCNARSKRVRVQSRIPIPVSAPAPVKLFKWRAVSQSDLNALWCSDIAGAGPSPGTRTYKGTCGTQHDSPGSKQQWHHQPSKIFSVSEKQLKSTCWMHSLWGCFKTSSEGSGLIEMTVRNTGATEVAPLAIPVLNFALRKREEKYRLLHLQCFHSMAQKKLNSILTCIKNILQGILTMWVRRCEPGRVEE